MDWIQICIAITLGAALLLLAGWVAFYYYIKIQFLGVILRIFQEKPLFIIPRGKPTDDAEEVTLETADGLKLAGCYLATTQPKRRGVILFGLEFGSNRWACVPYCQFLRDAGFDIFSFEFRNQGDSDQQSGYDPLQWVTEYEVQDMQAALRYLQNRPDRADGIGFFGISKGAGAGFIAATQNDYVRCIVTDGMFATHSTMVPYMRKWIAIYSTKIKIQRIIPTWYYSMFARIGLKQIERKRHCRFPPLERYVTKTGNRPLLMIHGGADNYIKPEMAEYLFNRAKGPKEFWLVDKAKHNQSFQIAGDEYQKKVLAFFQAYLGNAESQGNHHPRQRNKQEPVTAGKS